MSDKVLIKRLKEEMQNQNWTGRKLSKKANLSYNAIHYILSGKTKSTNFEVVNSIADVLGVSPFYLLDENQQRNASETRRKSSPSFSNSNKAEVSYDGELYRQIMCIVEEVLESRNKLTTHNVEHFTRSIYPQIKKDQSESNNKDIRSYIEGIIDYALNTQE